MIQEDPGRKLLHIFVGHSTISAVIKYRVLRMLLRLSTTTALITVGEMQYVRFNACAVISKRCYNLYNSSCIPYVFPEMFATLIVVPRFVRA